MSWLPCVRARLQGFSRQACAERFEGAGFGDTDQPTCGVGERGPLLGFDLGERGNILGASKSARRWSLRLFGPFIP